MELWLPYQLLIHARKQPDFWELQKDFLLLNHEPSPKAIGTVEILLVIQRKQEHWSSSAVPCC